jgi:quercetin dioxygenase-like cupin family protein
MAEKIQKLNAGEAQPGSHGEALMIRGANMALREWNEGPNQMLNQNKKENSAQGGGDHAQDYDTLGYVIDGEARLCSGDETWHLTKGDSWFVPKGALHRYEIETSFRAVEVTSPPARGQGGAGEVALGGSDAA